MESQLLRDRLVRTTLDLLSEQGLEGLSLRSIARRAGVSHGAPLRHFASLADLLSEVAAHGFSTDVWVQFKVFGTLALTLVLAFVQTFMLMRYARPEEHK